MFIVEENALFPLYTPAYNVHVHAYIQMHVHARIHTTKSDVCIITQHMHIQTHVQSYTCRCICTCI